MAYLFICGIQSASRLLFIIWNFNEDSEPCDLCII